MKAGHLYFLLCALFLFPLIVTGQNCGCAPGDCCSKYGYCGSGSDYCGAGCQSGPCSNSTTTTVSPLCPFTPCADTDCCSLYGYHTFTQLLYTIPQGIHLTKYTYCGNTSAYCGTGCQAGPCIIIPPTLPPTNVTPPTGHPPTSAPRTWPTLLEPVRAICINHNTGIDNVNQSLPFIQAIDAGYNLVILAFLVSGQVYDAAAQWQGLGASVQQSVIAYAHSKGARITVSTGGFTDKNFGTYRAADYGAFVANFAIANHLDGVDFDLENFARTFNISGMTTAETIQWVADATNVAREILGSHKLITHAPQPPYFGVNNGWSNAYPQIYAKAPSIDFLLVQYYNNGPATNYTSIFTHNNGIHAAGIPLEKIVVGKPVLAEDATEFVPPVEFGLFVDIAGLPSFLGGIDWHTGVMGWVWHNETVNKQWIHDIYPLLFLF